MNLVRDDSGNIVQSAGLPATGATTNLASAVGSAATASSLTAGLYRITSDINARICAGATATANDMPIWANSVEYLYINDTPLAAYCAASGGTISATKV